MFRSSATLLLLLAVSSQLLTSGQAIRFPWSDPEAPHKHDGNHTHHGGNHTHHGEQMNGSSYTRTHQCCKSDQCSARTGDHHGPHPPHGPFVLPYKLLNKTIVAGVVIEERLLNDTQWATTNTTGWSWETSLPSAVKARACLPMLLLRRNHELTLVLQRLTRYTQGFNAKVCLAWTARISG